MEKIEIMQKKKETNKIWEHIENVTVRVFMTILLSFYD